MNTAIRTDNIMAFRATHRNNTVVTVTDTDRADINIETMTGFIDCITALKLFTIHNACHVNVE